MATGAAVVLNLALFGVLLGYTIHTGPASTWVTLLAVLVFSFVFEFGYRSALAADSSCRPRLPSAQS